MSAAQALRFVDAAVAADRAATAECFLAAVIRAECLRDAEAGGGFFRFLICCNDMMSNVLDLCWIEIFSGYEKGAPSLKTKCANKNTHVQNVTFEKIKKHG